MGDGRTAHLVVAVVFFTTNVCCFAWLLWYWYWSVGVVSPEGPAAALSQGPGE